MSDPDMERRHFEQTMRHVAELEGKIARQEAILSTLDRDGHDTREGERLLHVFRDLLEQARIHQTLIVERLGDKKDG